MVKFKKKLVAGLITAGLSMPMAAMATNGYFSHGYGIKHKGMAGAGVAAPSSTMSTATNPAALQSQGNRVDFGVEWFQPNRTATTRHDSVTYNGDGDSSFFIPEFGYSSAIDSNRSWGVVVYGNGGMNTRYSGAPYATASGTNTGVDLAQLFIAPTYSMKINEKNTFGVSLNIIYQTFEAYGMENFAGFSPDGNNANLSDEGSDSSTGFSIKLGWMVDVTDKLTLGLAYQTESDMEEFSKYHDLFAEAGDFDIPSNWTIGLTFKATPKLKVMFDIQQINYTDVASISNPNDSASLGGSGVGQGFLGSSNGLGFGWDDMTIYKLGFEYQTTPNLVMRFGYSQGDQPIPASETAFNLIAPAVIEEHATIGGTWTLQNKAELTFYYMHAFENTVTGSTNINGSSGNANITMDQDALGVAYGWNF